MSKQEKLYKLKRNLETSKNKTFLKKKIKDYIKNHPTVSSIIFGTRKTIWIEKWIEVNIKEKQRYRINRLQSFFCGIELINKATYYTEFEKDKYEIQGITQNGVTVIVHLRREKNKKKDSYIFYISSYYKEK